MKKLVIILSLMLGLSTIGNAAIAYEGSPRKIYESSTLLVFTCDPPRDRVCCIIWEDGTGTINWPSGSQNVLNIHFDEVNNEFTAELDLP